MRTVQARKALELQKLYYANDTKLEVTEKRRSKEKNIDGKGYFV